MKRRMQRTDFRGHAARSLRHATLAVLVGVSAQAAAQVVPVDPDWRESEAPPPPVPAASRMIPIDMPGSSLRFGVDAASVSVGRDGVVRYVVLAIGAGGAMNAIYEGVRCSTAEVKVYARQAASGGWVPTPAAEWQRLHEVTHSRHSLVIARNGACVGHGAAGTAADIVRNLKEGPDRRFTQ